MSIQNRESEESEDPLDNHLDVSDSDPNPKLELDKYMNKLERKHYGIEKSCSRGLMWNVNLRKKQT